MKPRNEKLAKAICKEIVKKAASEQAKQILRKAKEETNINDLWTYACGGEIDKLKEYYDNGGKTNRRYNRFNVDHSLIMGALRNSELETVKFLEQKGEKLLPHEKEEYKELMELNNKK